MNMKYYSKCVFLNSQKVNISPKYHRNISILYRDVDAVEEIPWHPPQYEEEIRREIIWYNWWSVEQWKLFGTASVLGVTEMILGISWDNGNSHKKVTNCILLTAKFYLQAKAFPPGNNQPDTFLEEAKKRLETERMACHLEGRTTKFQPWKRIHEALEGVGR